MQIFRALFAAADCQGERGRADENRERRGLRNFRESHLQRVSVPGEIRKGVYQIQRVKIFVGVGNCKAGACRIFKSRGGNEVVSRASTLSASSPEKSMAILPSAALTNLPSTEILSAIPPRKGSAANANAPPDHVAEAKVAPPSIALNTPPSTLSAPELNGEENSRTPFFTETDCKTVLELPTS